MKVAIYARVSTDDGGQDPAVQVGALLKWLEAQGHHVARVFTDYVSGAKRDRPQLNALLAECAGPERAFEAVAVVKLDRLARSTQHLIELAARLEELGVDLMVKDQAIDTSTPAGKLMFHVLAAIAEFERDLIRERTRAGMAHAKARGAAVGRPRRSIDVPRARRMLDNGLGVAEVARRLRVPRSTLRAALGRS